MESVRFMAAFSDGDRVVELSYLRGGYYHIYVGGFYQGQILLIQGEWTVCPQEEYLLDMDDRGAILDRIQKSPLQINAEGGGV